MKRKIMLILIALVTLCIAVGAVSAWEFSFGSQSSSSSSVSSDGDVASVDYKDGVLKINDKQFKIPNGYNQNDNKTLTGVLANVSGADGAKMSAAYFTNGDKAISVKYIYMKDADLNKYTPASTNSQNQTIENHAGFLEKNIDGTVTFTYLEDGKMIQIDASDEATINEILK